MNPTGTEDGRPIVTDIRQKRDAGWGVAARQVQSWPALLAILVAMALCVTLPGHLYYDPVWLLPAVEGALFLTLLVARWIEGRDRNGSEGSSIANILPG